ncbi:MAG: hypothetical protein JO161_06545 [Planctomycetaceae bacterium]|nr:hypothetical protein [Planctomycetaceae bacterium]
MMAAQNEAVGQEITGHVRQSQVLNRSRLILVWAIWIAFTLVLFLHVQHYARNIPYMDDWAMVPVITGHEPITLKWAWAQHNEHRMLVPKLILAFLFRWVAPDFRTGMYFNAGLLSLAAALMIVLAYRLRGYQKLTDAVFPLSILSLAQSEVLLLNYALPLVLSSWLAFALIHALGRASDQPPFITVIPIGIALVMLPLCGGSGLVMLPPLMLWLAGYLFWGWWSGREPSGWTRAFGLSSLMACSVIITLYLIDYVRPVHHPVAPSLAAIARGTLEFLSLSIHPDFGGYWKAAALIVAAMLAMALVRLAMVAIKLPHERPRAFGLAAVILSMMGVAVSVGVSRCGFGPGAGLASRYVTLAAPLLSVLYITWLIYSPGWRQRVLHACLLMAVSLSVPYSVEGARLRDRHRLRLYRTVEQSLKAGVSDSQFLDVACPGLFPLRNATAYLVKMLRSSKFGDFKYLHDDQEAAQIAVSRTPDTARR